ncbi:hypothetical protein BSZ39_09105 [Bowdeniella nasicola]|uniref:PemK-like, MazF-like toxin of type II toxin-antitoxin system n=1 Tax=Bowdeniella nasicola TaxID=208480 RepID=A0A1Q5Q1M1_9ACTO|nr:hypothetical protein [Bowdeniella nasicola]OKL53500.1 hypothetical protein BSZ39_09105 [Bowdeniella nasicola]
MSFLFDVVVDFVSDMFVSKPTQRERRMRKLTACAEPIPVSQLPALTYDDGSVGALQPGSIAWAKLPGIEPVLVLAHTAEDACVARLVEVATPGAVKLSHAARWELLKNRNAVDLNSLYTLPMSQLYSEGKRIRRSDFGRVVTALGQREDG